MFLAAAVAQERDDFRRPRGGRGWIWFFAVLTILAVAAIAIQLWFNTQQQLTPQRLADARRKWNEKGPRDYDLDYTLSRIDSKDQYHVEVRD